MLSSVALGLPSIPPLVLETLPPPVIIFSVPVTWVVSWYPAHEEP